MNTKNKNTSITIKTNENFYNKLDKFCKETDHTKTFVIKKAVEKYMNNYEKNKELYAQLFKENENYKTLYIETIPAKYTDIQDKYQVCTDITNYVMTNDSSKTLSILMDEATRHKINSTDISFIIQNLSMLISEIIISENKATQKTDSILFGYKKEGIDGASEIMNYCKNKSIDILSDKYETIYKVAVTENNGYLYISTNILQITDKK